MRSIGQALLTLTIFLIVGFIYTRVLHYHPRRSGVSPLASPQTPDTRSSFHCDGRTYCSEMTSCAEAKYFLTHCPNVKMDGDNDGVPCESQWCPSG
jgi:Excalibur calcium-binding domain